MIPLSQLAEAERFFHDKIPLTRAMGLRVTPSGEGAFAVEAPVALNYNHLHTGFGGSINAVATLAAYGFLWRQLYTEEAELVVADSTIRFLAPVRETIRGVCASPAPERLAEFRRIFAMKGRARLRLHVQVSDNGMLAAEFHGTFVAFRQGK